MRKSHRLLEPVDHHGREVHEGDDLADRGEAADIQPRADRDDRQDRERGRRLGEHRGDRPPRQNRDLRRQQLVDEVLQVGHFGVDAGKTLHQGDVAQGVRRALGDVGVAALDRALQLFGLGDGERGEEREHDAEGDQQQRQPPVEIERQRQKHDQGDVSREVIAEEREPQHPQRVGALQHHLHQPAGMGRAVVGLRQLHHVLEVVGEHGLAPSVRQAVGIKRHQRPEHDGEEAEDDPGHDQSEELGPDRGRAFRLRASERVDDAAEQNRLGELGNHESDVADRQTTSRGVFPGRAGRARANRGAARSAIRLGGRS